MINNTRATESTTRMPDQSFWKGRRVFLTGHTGFKGSWLSLWLHSLGAAVRGYALGPPTRPSLFEQAREKDLVGSTHGDTRDFNGLKAALADCQPEVIIHLAAQTVVRTGYDDPIETYSSNVMGTVHLFEAVRQLRHPCAVVNVTSDKCYENREWAWGYREDDTLGGRDPYSNSKGCAELVTSAYRQSFFSPTSSSNPGVALASARAGNVIGGGDWTPHQLIPDLIRSFLAGQSCEIRSPFSTRPWQFVLEPLRGYLLLAERLAERPEQCASAWNFGPVDADVRSVQWIADRLVHAWGNDASWSHSEGQHVHEDRLLKLDVSKAAACLGWRPALRLNEALDWIVEWYRAFAAGADLQRVTLEQIERYQGLACD